MAAQMLKDGCELAQGRRQLQGLRWWAPGVAQLQEPRKHSAKATWREDQHVTDVDDECTGQIWWLRTERPLVGAAPDSDALTAFLRHSDKPGIGEDMCSRRRAGQIEGVDILVGSIELPDQHVGDGLSPVRDRWERDVAGTVVDLK